MSAELYENAGRVQKPLDEGGLAFKVKNDHRSKFSNLSNWKEEA